MNREGPEDPKAGMTDQQLVRAYAERRDGESISAFFARHQDSLLRFASSITGDEDRAQDVVQETFVNVMRRPDRLLAVDSCRNWLLRVTRNIGIDHLRRLARHRRHVQAMAEGTPNRSNDTSEEVDRADDRDRVRQEIDGLENRQQELVILKVEHGKSYREIAEITGLTLTQVSYRMHVAMKTLSKRLRHKDRVS